MVNDNPYQWFTLSKCMRFTKACQPCSLVEGTKWYVSNDAQLPKRKLRSEVNDHGRTLQSKREVCHEFQCQWHCHYVEDHKQSDQRINYHGETLQNGRDEVYQ